MLGVVIALPAEASCLLGRNIDIGRPQHHHDILIHISGMGPERASRAASALLQEGATALLSWGTAAALAPDLSSGALLVPERILLQDGSSSAVDPHWWMALVNSLNGHLAVNTGLLISSDTPLDKPAAKRRLFAHTGALAVDMESAAIAAIASAAGLPFACIRAVVDSAEMPIPELALTAVDVYGRPRIAALLSGLLRQPMAAGELLRLGRSFARARRTLRAVRRCCGYNLALPASLN